MVESHRKNRKNWIQGSRSFRVHSVPLCVREGLRKIGLERYNVVGISYGGYVAYQMAANYGEEVNKLVIISSGLCYTEEQKDEYLKKLGNNIYDLLLPQKPIDVRNMIKLAMYKTDPLKWVPDFFVWASIWDSRQPKLSKWQTLI
ncbi:hypothetical protein K2173_019117 [Erythroxylum novogranatense]|uniref:AB hydrolase-1 domain-containing protein n=1 Tax=Erythroxylum novogranatense TaxID=1862640 RepID=A0AAV8STN7_9ROSI|nr:hypothetical protein K2173_019117 [Erythroxylum novogranatense]